jgi:hypothetical protein
MGLSSIEVLDAAVWDVEERGKIVCPKITEMYGELRVRV